MAMLVNRSPVDDDTLEAIREHCADVEFLTDTIPADALDADGRALLAEETVEGEPAEGLTLHGTRWGRQWCAYITVD